MASSPMAVTSISVNSSSPVTSRNDGKSPVSYAQIFAASRFRRRNAGIRKYLRPRRDRAAQTVGREERLDREIRNARECTCASEEKREERQKWDDRRACFRNSTIFDAVARGSPRRKETGEIFTKAAEPIERSRCRGCGRAAFPVQQRIIVR